jgi:hypothetical protein
MTRSTVATILLFPAVGLAVISLLTLLTYLPREKLRKRGVRTTAKLVWLEGVDSSGRHKALVIFEVPDRRKVQFLTYGNPNSYITESGDVHSYPQGTTEVLYDPLKPKRAQVAFEVPDDGRKARLFLRSSALVVVVLAAVSAMLG